MTLDAVAAIDLSMSAALPGRVGNFVFLDHLGSGGMGVVFAAYDTVLDRKVAVKLLGGAQARESADAQARLLREAQALARLDHPNVVAVHDVGTYEDRVYVAMEFVDGRTLAEWARASRRSWREILAAIVAAGEGLAAAHDKGLVHRDIKPDNMMVGADGRVRVMDFGLARVGAAPEEPGPRPDLVPRGATRLTRTGAFMGTPAYMAPELFRGEPADARSDQFALCASAWELLHGRRAFAGDDLASLVANVTAGEVSPGPRGAAPAWLVRVLVRGLATDPAARFADMPALLRALRADPTRRRRAAWAIAGAVAIAGGVITASEVAERRAIAGCEAEGAAIFEAWSGAARADLERAFVATGKPNAATTFALTTPWLDRWAEGWRDATFTACRAATLDGSWDDELRARAGECLDEAQANFVALVRGLPGADGAALNGATQAAAALTPAGLCVDPTLLRERPLMRPEQRDEVLAVRAALATAASLATAVRYDDALKVAREALSAAEATRWPALVAQAELRVATIAEESGAYADAETGLMRALTAAREARSARLALEAITDLVYVVGYRASRHAEGKVWAESARLQLALLGEPHPLEAADLDSNLAGVHYTAGDYPEAVRLFQRALEAREAALGEEHPRVIETLGNLASVNFSMGDLEASKRLYLRALAVGERVLGPDHPIVATNLHNLSLIYETAGEFDEAVRVLHRAIAIREAALGPDHPLVAASLANLGLVDEASGAYDEAVRLFERALEIQERAYGPDHPLVAGTLHNLASVRFDQRDYEESARLLTRAIALYEAGLGPDHPHTASGLTALALVRYTTGDLEGAIALNDRALAAQERLLGADHPDLAHALLVNGEALVDLGRAGEAVPLLERARALREGASVQPAELAEVRFALARGLWDANTDRARARALAERAAQDFAGTSGTERIQSDLHAWLSSHVP